MSNRVFYHHPQNKQYSLDFVNPELESIGNRIVEYEDDVSVKAEAYDLDRTVYVVYTESGASGAADAIDFDLVDQIQAMEPANSVIATRFVDLFESILEENLEEEGKRVKAYKDIVAEEIEPALNQVDFSGTATDVAGRLGSNLILKHTLPNANHRTSIGMIQLYLRRIEPEFSMPKTARQKDEKDEYGWMDWVNEYIVGSKRILTVRRKGDPFRYLAEFGCDLVERKGGIEIWLDEYDLSLPPSERWEQYAKEHEALWIDFTEEAVRRSEYESLRDADAITKHQFAEELKIME